MYNVLKKEKKIISLVYVAKKTHIIFIVFPMKNHALLYFTNIHKFLNNFIYIFFIKNILIILMYYKNIR
ncbi:MAG: hypothetical protein NEHIOOID_01205 [Holosporales bacterium]